MTAAAFWRWFARHEQAFWERGAAAEDLLSEMQVLLGGYCKGLRAEFSDVDQGVRDLVLTVDGDSCLFACVEALAQAAPSFCRWKVFALRPPRGFDFTIDAEGVHIDPAGMRFDPLISKSKPGAVGIRVFVPTSGIDNRIRSLVMMALQVALGERVAAASLQHVEVCPMPPDSEELIPLDQLPQYLDWVRTGPSTAER